MKDVFPYNVFYPRTAKWWDSDWHEISSWLTNAFGPCAKEWEYYSDQCFYFKTEEHKVMFKLRWGK